MRILPLLFLLILTLILTIEILSQPTQCRDRTEEKEYAIKLLEEPKEESPQGGTIITREGENHITVNYCNISPSDDKQTKRSVLSLPSIPQQGIFSSEHRLFKRLFSCFSGGGSSRRDKGKEVASLPEFSPEIEARAEEAINILKGKMKGEDPGSFDIACEDDNVAKAIDRHIQQFREHQCSLSGNFVEDHKDDGTSGRFVSDFSFTAKPVIVNEEKNFRFYFGTPSVIARVNELYAAAAERSRQPSHAHGTAEPGRSRPSSPIAATDHGRRRPHAPAEVAEHRSSRPRRGSEPAGLVSNLPSHASSSGGTTETETDWREVIYIPELEPR